MTMKSMGGTEVDVKSELQQVISPESFEDRVFTFWWSDQICIGFQSLEEPELKVEVEVILLDDNPDDIKAIEDVTAEGIDGVLKNLTAVVGDVTGITPEFSIEGVGPNGSAGYSAVISDDINLEEQD